MTIQIMVEIEMNCRLKTETEMKTIDFERSVRIILSYEFHLQ